MAETLTKLIVAAIAILASAASAADHGSQRGVYASANGHFLTRSNGEPFFWLGDIAADLFVSLTREEVDAYLRNRASKGFTVILAVAMGSGYGEMQASTIRNPVNRYGQRPFFNNDPLQPNPSYWEHVDWCMSRATHYGLKVALMPTSAAITISGDQNGRLFDAIKARAYGQWLASRYRESRAIWVLGGDANPLWVPQSMGKFGVVVDFRPVYDAMAAGILQGSGGDAFITYHPSSVSFLGTAEPRTSLYLGNREWLDMNMIHSGQFEDYVPSLESMIGFSWNGAFNYEAISAEYIAVPTRPVIDGQPAAEDLLLRGRRFTAYDCRNRAFHSVFEGAAGYMYFNINVEHFYDPRRGSLSILGMRMSWKDAMDSDGARQMSHIKALMLSRPYLSRIPDRDVVIGGADEGEDRVSSTRDAAGSFVMIYVPKGRQIRVDLSRVSGISAAAWWYDPRTGVAKRIGTGLPTTGTREFIPPTSGDEADWVLVIDDAGKRFRTPGSRSCASISSPCTEPDDCDFLANGVGRCDSRESSSRRSSRF